MTSKELEEMTARAQDLEAALTALSEIPEEDLTGNESEEAMVLTEELYDLYDQIM